MPWQRNERVGDGSQIGIRMDCSPPCDWKQSAGDFFCAKAGWICQQVGKEKEFSMANVC